MMDFRYEAQGTKGLSAAEITNQQAPFSVFQENNSANCFVNSSRRTVNGNCSAYLGGRVSSNNQPLRAPALPNNTIQRYSLTTLTKTKSKPKRQCHKPLSDIQFIRMSATKAASEEQDRFLEETQSNEAPHYPDYFNCCSEAIKLFDDYVGVSIKTTVEEEIKDNHFESSGKNCSHLAQRISIACSKTLSCYRDMHIFELARRVCKSTASAVCVMLQNEYTKSENLYETFYRASFLSIRYHLKYKYNKDKFWTDSPPQELQIVPPDFIVRPD